MEESLVFQRWSERQRLQAQWSNEVLTEHDLQCGYSSKRCTNVRTTKKGGGLHRFCEFHRHRANENQRRVDDKRRMQRSLERQKTQIGCALSVLLPDPVDISEDETPLTQDDIQFLEEMLGGSDLPPVDGDDKLSCVLYLQASPGWTGNNSIDDSMQNV